MRGEFETIAADEAPVQPIAARIRFRLEFALLMLAAGRTEQAGAAFDRVFELLDELAA
jgi:C4-dicarboxylate-specific signal transduction histidine kinase